MTLIKLSQHMMSAAVLLVLVFSIPLAYANKEPVCVYISSYHSGLECSDRIESGLRKGLSGKCRVVQHDMDTKRNKDVLKKHRSQSL